MGCKQSSRLQTVEQGADSRAGRRQSSRVATATGWRRQSSRVASADSQARCRQSSRVATAADGSDEVQTYMQSVEKGGDDWGRERWCANRIRKRA